MAIEKFKEWYENRHDYQKDWKKRTGGKVVGFFCPYFFLTHSYNIARL
jgi:hypothetical protein